jgi:hypothetical protein
MRERITAGFRLDDTKVGGDLLKAPAILPGN